jgi:hypothetical protein
MRLIAFVTDFHQVQRIPEHIGEETTRPPPLVPKIATHDLSQVEPVEDIPDLDVHVQDPICPD